MFDFEQCDSNTIKLINKDIFFFQSLFNESSCEQDDQPFAPQFGTRQTTQMDGSIINIVTIPPKVKENHFQHCHAKLLKTMKKHVDENIKDKKKHRATVARTAIKFTTHFFWCHTVKKKVP